MFLADNIKLSSWLPAGATVLLASPIVQADNFMLQPGIELTGSQSLNLVHFIDHDHDGLTDVVAHDAARMKIHVFRQTSAKLIEPTPSLSIPNVLSPYSQSADLNEDGYCDLVYQSGSQLHIMLSSSAGLTAAGSILISEPLHHLTAIGDFDGDGHIDLFLSPHVRDVYDSLLNPKPHILWGIGNGGFEEMPTPLPNIGNHRTAYYRFI
ncbi:MAG: FG-GAP repeat domain-containing protein, partial [Akkermansiaceae bacterium]